MNLDLDASAEWLQSLDPDLASVRVMSFDDFGVQPSADGVTIGVGLIFVDPGCVENESSLRALLIHEAGHAIDVATTMPPSPPPSPERLRAMLAADATAWTIRRSITKFMRLCPGHGARWVRYCCHLWTRATLRGDAIEWPQVVGSSDCYGLAGMDEYPADLAGELRSFPSDRRLADLASIPPPKQFVSRFSEDVASHARMIRNLARLYADAERQLDDVLPLMQIPEALAAGPTKTARNAGS